MDILPKNITTAPSSGLGQKAAVSGSGGGGLKLPPIPKKGIESLEIKFEESKLPLIFSLVILFLVIAAYGGLFFYGKSLDEKIKAADTKLAELKERMDKISLASILDLQKSLIEAKALLAGHIYSSNVLRLLEELTLPKVQWSSFSLDAGAGDIALSGRAEGYTTLAKQMLVLEEDKDKRILQYSTSGVSLDHNGGVTFDMAITLNKKMLTKFPQ
jgi:hypothetical protein